SQRQRRRTFVRTASARSRGVWAWVSGACLLEKGSAHTEFERHVFSASWVDQSLTFCPPLSPVNSALRHPSFFPVGVRTTGRDLPQRTRSMRRVLTITIHTEYSNRHLLAKCSCCYSPKVPSSRA